MIQFWGALPGDFREGKPIWMCVSSQCDSSFMGHTLQDPDCDITREFWDNIWSWRFNGTTSYAQWDKRLVKLAENVGVYGVFQETELDSEATSKGWTKLESKQPAMASYKKDDVRLNFYLNYWYRRVELGSPSERKDRAIPSRSCLLFYFV